MKNVCKYEMKNTVQKYTLQCTKNALHNDFINEFCFFVFTIAGLLLLFLYPNSEMEYGASQDLEMWTVAQATTSDSEC